MLVRLTVHNYALIRKLDIEPGESLTIITGETGAGKTILLGALALVLGARADTSVLLNSSRKCVVEGLFNIAGKDMEDFFEENDLDYDDSCIIRREINPAGKSRAFINDTPVNLNILRFLGNSLVDIHSQHSNLLLNDSLFQIGVIDSIAENKELLALYRDTYKEYINIRDEYKTLREGADKRRADMDYYQFQLKQMDDAALVGGELSCLENERDMLSNAGDINLSLNAVRDIITFREVSIHGLLTEVKLLLSKVSHYIEGGDEFLHRINSAAIDLDDVSMELTGILDNIESDPGRLQVVNDRLDLISSLMHKHNAGSEDELIARRDELRRIVSEIETGGERLDILEKQLETSASALTNMATRLTLSRESIVPVLEERLTTLLQSLGMPNARFKVRLNKLSSFTPAGSDRVEFLFSANRQTEPELLSQVASGGELSRVMLCLKYLLCRSANMPTVIFDEIDAGVSGEVAVMVGEMLSEMGSHMQVINITHLPQIAALGNKHFFVYKNDTADETITGVKLLDENEKLMEIARLLSGSDITKSAVEHAKILISGR